MENEFGSDRPGYDPTMTSQRAILFYGQVSDHATLEWDWSRSSYDEPVPIG